MAFLKEKLSKLSVKKIVLVVSLAFLLFAVISGGTIAYLFSVTPPAKNEFTPAVVSCEVEEKFENNLKTEVAVKNTGNTDAYIRATVVATFIKTDGSVYFKAPVEGVDYKLTLGSDKWIKGSDGFFYYTEKVAFGSSTEMLISSAESLNTAPEGYELSLQIVASALQSDPETVVSEVWGAQASDGKLTVN